MRGCPAGGRAEERPLRPGPGPRATGLGRGAGAPCQGLR